VRKSGPDRCFLSDLARRSSTPTPVGIFCSSGRQHQKASVLFYCSSPPSSHRPFHRSNGAVHNAKEDIVGQLLPPPAPVLVIKLEGRCGDTRCTVHPHDIAAPSSCPIPSVPVSTSDAVQAIATAYASLQILLDSTTSIARNLETSIITCSSGSKAPNSRTRPSVVSDVVTNADRRHHPVVQSYPTFSPHPLCHP
jgi:hypothetical protein